MRWNRFKNRRRASSALARQKVPRSGAVTNRFRWRSVLLAFGGVVGASILLRTFPLTSRFQSHLKTSPGGWQIDLANHTESGVASEVVEKILAKAKSSLTSGSTRELSGLAREIHEMALFAAVDIRRTGLNSVVITLTPLETALCLRFGDVIRRATVSGHIFGDPIPSSAGCRDVPLRMAAWRNQKASRSSRPEVTTTNQEDTTDEVIKEAIDLLERLRGARVDLSDFEYAEHRGFVVWTLPHATEVVIGRTPFEGKITKLLELNRGLIQRGEVATRVELDFRNKAFVRLQGDVNATEAGKSPKLR